MCIAFHNTRRCRFGDRCRFTDTPGRAAPKAKAKAKQKPKAGPKAKHAATPRAAPKAGQRTEYDPEKLAARAKIPRNAFSNGRCRFGDRCHYPHSADSANVALHVPAFEFTDFENTTSEEEDEEDVHGIF